MNLSTYYEELLQGSATALLKLDMGEVSSSFSRKLKMLPPELYKEVTSWVYALIKIHSSRNNACATSRALDVMFPYNPNISEMRNGEYFITYNLPKIPSRELQGVLLGYMSECIHSI